MTRSEKTTINRYSRLWGLAWMAFAAPVFAESSFTAFESGQVRPLALSPDGTTLFALNTPDNRLEIFRVGDQSLKPVGSVPVGLEPVALAVRNSQEVWVVNHLSDSVSVVHIDDNGSGRVTRTLLVGDEPRDIVFAGPDKSRAFITTAHRGQNTGRDPQLTTPGVGRADVWVFDADQLSNTLAGVPLTVLTLFTDTPRALAVTPDGSTVYAAGFYTGNGTMTLNDAVVERGIAAPFTRVYPGPTTNHAGEPQPKVGLIVKYDGSHWVDELGQQWDDMVPFSLPDRDVFTIDANANPPAAKTDGDFCGVGTTLFNMVVNPANGKVYVSNLEAMNHNRFEGEGIYSNGQTVRGHLAESRITVLGPQQSVTPRHLNKHIDYSRCCAPIPNPENEKSVAFPLDMAITQDGKTLYVAAFGTSEVARYDTGELEEDRFVPDSAAQIHVSGGGPSGLALDEKRGLLYVLTRFDNSISIINTATGREIKHVAMFNPEPKHIVEGRRFLYDAAYTSSHGDSACASCHIFGDMDALAWDLGDPDGDEGENPGPFRTPPQLGAIILGHETNQHYRPMKGPMTTQSLRGLDNHGPLHWRGDRTGGNDANALPNSGPSVQPNGGIFDEDKAFRKFNVAFPGLVGRHEMLPADEMQKFADFILELTYPPNPIRNLDNSLTPEQQAGRDFYFKTEPSDSFFACNGCHVLDRNGNAEFAEVKKPGFFGTDGHSSFDRTNQFFKVPHLRNMYQKVGMFGMAPQSNSTESTFFLPRANVGDMGPQIRGFGFGPDGSVDTLFRFLSAQTFARSLFADETDPSDTRTPVEKALAGINVGNPGGFDFGPAGITERRNVEAFLLAFDTNLFPIVGQQVTLNQSNAELAASRIDLLIAQAEANACDLVAKNRYTGFLYLGNGQFQPSSQDMPALSDGELRASAAQPGGDLTYTCVPPGSGLRIGIDRDNDGVLDNDETAAGDLDGDGDVDGDDLNLLLAAKNTVAVLGDSKDLDHDGKVTAQDARKLVSLCSRTRCATN
jgi:DNA-binding beta-propeller fold protein YncE